MLKNSDLLTPKLEMGVDVEDYICYRSTLLKNLERKFGKSITILKIEDVGEGLKKYTFEVGRNHELRVTTTEDGLMFILLKLSLQQKSICTYCECKDKEDCLQSLLDSGKILPKDVVQKFKLDKKLVLNGI